MPIDVKKYVDVDSQDTPIIRYIEISKKRYGASLDTFFGAVQDGALKKPTELVDLVFDGVEDIEADALSYKFYNNAAIRSVSFPDLEDNDYRGLTDAFYQCPNLITLNCPKVKSFRCPSAFSYCPNLENVYLPELEFMRSMSYSFSGSKVTNLVMPKVKSITGANGCFANTQMTEIDMNSVESIRGGSAANAFLSNCKNLVSADFSGLTEINGQSACSNMFSGDENLELLDMSNLETVIGTNAMTYLCYGCSKLKTMTFDKLSKVGKSVGGYSYYEFQWAFAFSGLETLSFPALKNDSFIDYEVFTNMLNGVDGCTVHFPSNLQSVIGDWEDVQNGFGGMNTTVLFDLPETE